MNAEAAPPDAPFAGKYRLLRLLGKGAMGEVWLAEQEGPRNFRRRVAVKRLISTPTELGEIATASFVAEAQVIARLDHPNIVRLIELGTVEHELYLVLDYVDGTALDRMLRKKYGGSALSPKAVAYIGREIALALEAVHSLCDESGRNYGVVHRDVTPSNILISRDGRVRLTDFGVARISGFAGDKTEAGVFKGKLPYMPPEQARGEPFDGRADIFSLGVTLFEALLGQRPRHAETRTQLILMIATERLPRVRDLLPHVPASLAAAIDAMTELDPRTRISDAGKLAADLDSALHSLGPNAVREAKDEVRDRVEAIAGPPATSNTVSGAKMLQHDSAYPLGAASIGPAPASVPTVPDKRPPSWSIALEGAGEPHEPRSDEPSAPTGGLSPQTLRSAARGGSSGPPSSAQTGGRSRSILVAAAFICIGAAVTTALFLQRRTAGPMGDAVRPGAATPAATEQPAAPPTAVVPATPTEPASAPIENDSAKAPSKPVAVPSEPTGVPSVPGGWAADRTRIKPDTSAAASATPTATDPGSLQVVVLPWADVIVDGKAAGTTPLAPIQLAPGPHSIVLRNAELGAVRNMWVTVKPGAPTLLRVDLRKTDQQP